MYAPIASCLGDPSHDVAMLALLGRCHARVVKEGGEAEEHERGSHLVASLPLSNVYQINQIQALEIPRGRNSPYSKF